MTVKKIASVVIGGGIGILLGSFSGSSGFVYLMRLTGQLGKGDQAGNWLGIGGITLLVITLCLGLVPSNQRSLLLQAYMWSFIVMFFVGGIVLIGLSGTWDGCGIACT